MKVLTQEDSKRLFEVHRAVHQTIQTIAHRFGDGRRGGALVIADESGDIMFNLLAGSPDPNRWGTYQGFAVEKVGRLARRREHLTSWESRDPDTNRYGGAIRIIAPDGSYHYLIGFSGLPEDKDTPYALLVAVRANLISAEEARRIASRARVTESADCEAVLHDMINAVN